MLLTAVSSQKRRWHMGINSVGIAFSYTGTQKHLPKLLSKVFNGKAAYIQNPDFDHFSTILPNHVSVEIKPGVCFIENILFANLTGDHNSDISDIYRNLGSPKYLFFYFHNDRADMYGYSVVENGVRLRTRTQASGIPNQPPISEHGEQLPFERTWSDAIVSYEETDDPEDEGQKIYSLPSRGIETTEHYLTSQMLKDGIKSYFGVDLFEDFDKESYFCFHINQQMPKNKKWWEFWK